jgi:hypothetical protein
MTSNTATKITPMLAGNVLWIFTQSGREPGSFTWSLLNTISWADRANLALLVQVYPAHVEAVGLAKNTEDGIDVLRSIAAGEATDG